MYIIKILKGLYMKRFKNIPNNYFLALIKYLRNNKYRIRVDYTNYYKKCEIKENFILYESFGGEKMCGNPLAIFKALFNNPNFKNYQHIWVLNNLDNCRIEYKNLTNVYFVKKDSKRYLRYLSECKYLINNSTFPSYFIRKENQVYVNTWHGTPLKTLGKDMRGKCGQHKNIQRNLLQATHLINPNKYTADIMIKSHDIDGIYSGSVYDCGYPRVDLTISANKKILLQELGLVKGERIILYAPTWRGEVGDIVDNIDKIISDFLQLKESLGETYHILLRVHPLIAKKMDSLGLGRYTVPETIDTNELLAIVDILITDYSSIMFDYLVTKRPILFYAPDIEEYEIDRGLYLDYKELPGPVIRTCKELIQNIGDIEKVSIEYSKQYLEWIEKYCYNDDGNSTDRVIDIIFNGNKDNICNIVDSRINLLFYCGGFLNNGITTSAINLLNNIDYSKYNVIIVEKDKDSFITNLSKINPNVKVIFKCGAMNLTLYEHIIRSKVYNRGRQKNKNEKVIFQEIFYREKYRIFSNSRIDIAIDFSGYVKQWSQIFAYGDFKRKVIYQHNDIVAEYYKKIDGKWKHKDNLGMIFQLYPYYDQIISVSKEIKKVNREKLKKFIDIEQVTMKHINNSINYNKIFELSNIQLDDEKLKSLIHNMKTNKENFYFVNIGRLSPEKDQKKLLFAFKELASKYDNVFLLILGDGPLYKELHNLILELNLQEKVFLLGHIDNLFPILKNCSCLVSSSNYEGQPMCLLEALVLNTPIIATNIEGNKSVLKNGYGILVDNNVEGVLRGMECFIKEGYNPRKFDYLKYNNKVMNIFYRNVCKNKY